MKKLLAILSFPPPHHGVNVVNSALWGSRLRDAMDCRVLDISDRRSIHNLGRLDPLNVWLALRHLVELAVVLRRERPDVVYLLISQNVLAYLRDGLFITACSLLSRAKVCAHLHGSFFKTFHDEAPWWFRPYIAWTMRRVDRVIVLDESLGGLVEEWVDDVVAVGNGVDLFPDLDVDEVLERRRSAEGTTIVFLSNLIESKGILDFLEAAVAVGRERPDLRFEVAGSWGNDPVTGLGAEQTRQRAERIVTDGGIAERVRFLGVVSGDAKLALLRRADVFALPSTHPNEGQPLAILEALAAAVPVVASDSGLIPKTVESGRTGHVVKAGDVGALAEALGRLAGDDELRERASREARRRFEARHSLARFVDAMIAALDFGRSERREAA